MTLCRLGCKAGGSSPNNLDRHNHCCEQKHARCKRRPHCAHCCCFHGRGRAFVLGPGGAHALLMAALTPLNGHGGGGESTRAAIAPGALQYARGQRPRPYAARTSTARIAAWERRGGFFGGLWWLFRAALAAHSGDLNTAKLLGLMQ